MNKAWHLVWHVQNPMNDTLSGRADFSTYLFPRPEKGRAMPELDERQRKSAWPMMMMHATTAKRARDEACWRHYCSGGSEEHTTPVTLCLGQSDPAVSAETPRPIPEPNHRPVVSEIVETEVTKADQEKMGIPSGSACTREVALEIQRVERFLKRRTRRSCAQRVTILTCDILIDRHENASSSVQANIVHPLRVAYREIPRAPLRAEIHRLLSTTEKSGVSGQFRGSHDGHEARLTLGERSPFESTVL